MVRIFNPKGYTIRAALNQSQLRCSPSNAGMFGTLSPQPREFPEIKTLIGQTRTLKMSSLSAMTNWPGANGGSRWIQEIPVT